MSRHSHSHSHSLPGWDMDCGCDREMLCLSCEVYFNSEDAGTCKECYEEANETEEELEAEIDDLKAKIAFLKLLSPVNHCNRSDTDVTLVASDEGADVSALTVPAHKAVLVSF